MAKGRGGFVVIHRSIYDNPTFRSPAEALAFAFPISKAAWGPTKVQYRRRWVVLQRGQLTISVRDFAEAMERPRMWATRFLERLEKAGMVAKNVGQSRDSRGTVGGTVTNILTICNYDKYQGLIEEGGTVVEPPTGTPTGTENKEKKQLKQDINPSVVSPSRKQATAWPADLGVIPAEWEAWAISTLGWSKAQAAAEGMRFIDSAMAKRRTYVDWQAAWRQWCRSPYQKTVGAKQQALTL